MEIASKGTPKSVPENRDEAVGTSFTEVPTSTIPVGPTPTVFTVPPAVPPTAYPTPPPAVPVVAYSAPPPAAPTTYPAPLPLVPAITYSAPALVVPVTPYPVPPPTVPPATPTYIDPAVPLAVAGPTYAAPGVPSPAYPAVPPIVSAPVVPPVPAAILSHPTDMIVARARIPTFAESVNSRFTLFCRETDSSVVQSWIETMERAFFYLACSEWEKAELATFHL
ncbi:extensin-like [Zingiber officinale]|uniref:extensin-like n=1 Tax=Zingiber officinale TaxID=94328 RepID=UPI001C4D5BB4|nr:extensin-like [Zingiber officinale]